VWSDQNKRKLLIEDVRSIEKEEVKTEKNGEVD
jgi:hypothetical protein